MALSQGGFTFGVILIAAATLWLCLDLVLLERFGTLALRVSIAILITMAIASTMKLTFFAPTPLVLQWRSTYTAYGPGSVLHGITWKPQYSELNFEIENPSGTDYEKVELTISTDQVIADIRQKSGLSSCLESQDHPTDTPTWQVHLGDGTPIGPANNPVYDYYAMEYGPDGKPVGTVKGADQTWIVRCPELPAHTEADFFAAIENVNPVDYRSINAPLFLPPRAAASFQVSVDFLRTARERRGSISGCRMGDNCAMPIDW